MVRTGLDILLHDRLGLLRGKRVGLVTHPAATLGVPDFMSSLDALRAAGVNLTALFGMEHGFAGSAADGKALGNATDGRTGLPVFSLYGATKEPTAEMLAGVDLLIYDVQDVGVRFYTFISSLYYILRAAGEHGVPVIVLDRPNPLGGVAVEGPSIAPGFESFVGITAMPVRHGMTVGELARFFNAPNPPGPPSLRGKGGVSAPPSLPSQGREGGQGDERGRADLTVIPMAGWRRAMWFDDTGLPWVTTSPAMPHLSSATVYPGTCFLEGTVVSEGRGTALPFEQFGAPWMDAYATAEALNTAVAPRSGIEASAGFSGQRGQPAKASNPEDHPNSFQRQQMEDGRWGIAGGVVFRPTSFEPSSSKYAGETCYGVQLHVADRDALQPVRLGLQIIATLKALYPTQFAWRDYPRADGTKLFTLDRLIGTDRVRAALDAGASAAEIIAPWAAAEEAFRQGRQPYLLYE